MSSENTKSKRLPVVNSRPAAKTDYELAMDPDPKCGGCMWLRLRRPGEDDACMNLRLPDGAGNVIIINENSDTCKYFMDLTPERQAVYRALVTQDISTLQAAKKMITGIVRDKEEAKLKERPVFVKDIVEFTLTEQDDSVKKYRGSVSEVGKARITVAVVSPIPGDAHHIEYERIPLNLPSLRIIKSAAVEAVGEGVRSHGKAEGDPEQIRKSRIRRAKRLVRVLNVMVKVTKQGTKKVPLLSVLDELENLDVDIVKTSVAELRALKFIKRVDGKFKVLNSGLHAAKRVKGSNEVVVAWSKLERIAREKAGLKEGEPLIAPKNLETETPAVDEDEAAPATVTKIKRIKR